MANFQPLQNYILYCIDKLIADYSLKDPFLDIGCGRGDIASFLAKKQWEGVAIDTSNKAVAVAHKTLRPYSKYVEVFKKDLFEEKRTYNTVFLLDVLEHLKDDIGALNHISTILFDKGNLVLLVPSNMKFWKWDDRFYGHFRRYEPANLVTLLEKTGFCVRELLDCTYPLFWVMREFYTRMVFRPSESSEEVLTSMSAIHRSWESGFLSKPLDKSAILWKPLFLFQYHFFRKKVHMGHAVVVLARKK